MIKVGINENVVLESAEITDPAKGTLALTWRPAATGPALSAFESLKTEGYAETSGGNITLRIFSPLPPFETTQEGKPVPDAKRVKDAGDAIAEKKNLIYQILCAYMPSGDAKLDPYRGLGLTGANFDSRIVQEETLTKMMSNMSEDFIKAITPYLNKDEHAVRLLLVRQSKTKHFADFRSRFVKDNPVIESMKIPEAASKLKFNAHELKNGLDDGTPAGISEADKAAEDLGAQTVQSVFGVKS